MKTKDGQNTVRNKTYETKACAYIMSLLWHSIRFVGIIKNNLCAVIAFFSSSITDLRKNYYKLTAVIAQEFTTFFWSSPIQLQ